MEAKTFDKNFFSHSVIDEASVDKTKISPTHPDTPLIYGKNNKYLLDPKHLKHTYIPTHTHTYTHIYLHTYTISIQYPFVEKTHRN